MIAEEALAIPGAFDGIAWMRGKMLGEHHHFRVQCKCPRCSKFHVFDYTDVSAPRWLDPVKLGLTLLCGGCRAARRLICVERSGNRVLWFAPYFTPRDEAIAWATIRSPVHETSLATVRDHGPWIEADLPHPRARDPRLKDEARDECRRITQQFRLAFWEVNANAAVALNWPKPPPPPGYSAAPVVKIVEKEGSFA
jgi:hypothetical protein